MAATPAGRDRSPIDICFHHSFSNGCVFYHILSRTCATASQNGRCEAGRCAVACFWDLTLHSPRPCLRSVLRGSLRASLKTGKPPPLPALQVLPQIETDYGSAGGGRDALSRDARKGGMAFGAHEPPRTRHQPRPCRANPHCGGAPTNAALKGGIPESVSSRSTTDRIFGFCVSFG